MSEFLKTVESLSYAIQEYNPDNEETFTRIIDQLEYLSNFSHTEDTLALTDLVLLLQENLLTIYENKQILSEPELVLLKEWPYLFEQYVYKTSPIETSTAFLDNLSSHTWPNKLSEQDKQILREMLLPEETANISEVPLTETLTGLVNTLDKLIEGDNESLKTFYIQINSLCKSSQLNEQVGFHDLCLLAQDNVSWFVENDKEPDETQLILLSSWCKLAIKYLNTPGEPGFATALIQNLKDIHWPSSLSEQDADVLSDLLGIKEYISEQIAVHEVAFSFPQYLQKVKNLILRIKESEERIGEINTTLDNLLEMSSNENYLGLQDICMLYQEGINELANEPIQLLNEDTQFLAQWPDLVSDYYQNKTGPDSIKQLLNYLQDQRWQTPLSEEDAKLLENMLKEDQQIAHESSVHIKAEEKTEAEEDNNQSSIIELPATPQSVNQELVEMLSSEMDSINYELDQLIPSENNNENSLESLAQYSLKMERFGNACQAAELSGLFQSCVLLNENLNTFISKTTTYNQTHSDLLTQWPILISTYLKQLGSFESSLAVVNLLASDAWSKPILSDIRPALLDLLQAPYIIEKEQQRTERKTEVEPEDISIAIGADINEDLLEGLLQELPGQTADYSSCIQALFEGNDDLNILEKAQRIAHTIKGAANTVGIRGLALLTHQMEDILQLLMEHQKPPSMPLANTLLSGADCLEEMCDCLMERQPGPEYASAVLQDILNWANRLETDGIDILDEKMDMTSASVSISTNVPTNQESTNQEQAEEEKEKSQTPTIRIPTDVVDNLLRLVGETMILNIQLQDKIQNSTLQSKSFKDHSNSLRNLTNDLERYIEISGSAFSSQKAVNQNEAFDPLELEEYNELHSTSHRIVESATDAHEINLDIENNLKDINELLIDQSRIQQQIQESVMRTRMVPIASIIARLERSIRQTCRSTHKQARLEVSGENTLIDSTILNHIIDPLMHMIRNSIDHGIEAPEIRVEKKKHKTGVIKLDFSREGTQILIRFQDDGAGLDKEGIKQTAIKKGLINDKQELSDSELYQLIVQPGFSTRQETTLTSGRGIGMDVVYTQLLALNGSLEISSEKDKGICFELRLPASLMTSHAIFIKHQGQLLAISNNGIVQILHPDDGELKVVDGKQRFLFNDEMLPVYTLDTLLRVGKRKNTEGKNIQPALLVRQENSSHVVFVEEIVDSRNIVIKKTGNYLQKIQGILGATIAGDGSVVPVVELPELLRSSYLSKNKSQLNLAHTSIIKELPRVLIVDDSISARRAMSQILKDAGYDIQTAKDGLEAIAMIEKRIPAIALVDFEMPRMNGIELTSHIRAMDKLKHLPIIMITSRTTDKHRELALTTGVDEYMSKPVSDDALLDQIHNLIQK